MTGKLIIIESGTDASGKATQTKLLFNRLVREGCNVRKIEYPDYKSPSSSLIKMYLNGEFGKKPEDVNPYAASTFFAVDRYASFQKEWRTFYEAGGIVLADRYTTSNMVYQTSKIEDIEERNRFLDWLWDLEFNKFDLPVPDCVVFLDMDPLISQKLMENRENKFTGSKEKDIHESSFVYLIKTYNNACYVAEKYNWDTIKCSDNEQLKAIEAIHQEIYQVVKRVIKT